MKGSLARFANTFVRKGCEKAADEGRGSDIDKCIDLGDGMQLENIGNFFYFGNMPNGTGGANLAPVAKVRCAWKKLKTCHGSWQRKECHWS